MSRLISTIWYGVVAGVMSVKYLWWIRLAGLRLANVLCVGSICTSTYEPPVPVDTIYTLVPGGGAS